MKKPPLFLLVTVFLFVHDSSAAESNCAATAADMKLSGAAKNSFMKKCERDNDCEAKAASKKLAGAAKSSFVKKCIKDAKATEK